MTDVLLLAPPRKSLAGPSGDDKPITVQFANGDSKEFSGRPGWALRKLLFAGSRGISTAELPAGVRWSHYVHCLRKDGVAVRTDRERHTGEFEGTHGRYRLATPLTIVGGLQ